MDFSDVVKSRRSVRAFLPDPVPRDLIADIIETARWAPSWGNTQPWEIVTADGEKASVLAERFVEEATKGAAPRPDIDMPIKFEDPYLARYMALGRTLFEALGIERTDKEARNQHYLNMYRFFGAPACIYLTIDDRLNVPYSCLDIGSVGTTICYAACDRGLGTIYLAASMHYPDIVREVLEIPDTKKVVIGIAVGYPHPHAAASVFRSEREPVDSIMRFA